MPGLAFAWGLSALNILPPLHVLTKTTEEGGWCTGVWVAGQVRCAGFQGFKSALVLLWFAAAHSQAAAGKSPLSSFSAEM